MKENILKQVQLSTLKDTETIHKIECGKRWCILLTNLGALYGFGQGATGHDVDVEIEQRLINSKINKY